MHSNRMRNHILTSGINYVNQSNQFHQIALESILIYTFALAKFNHVADGWGGGGPRSAQRPHAHGWQICQC